MISKRSLFLLLLALSVFPSARAVQQNTPKVVMKTNFGDIAIELFLHYAPITVDNFLQYVDSGFYDGLIIHRAINDFMIQGGGYEPGPTKRTVGLRAPIINESYNGLSNLRGTLAMARTSDPNSATSQFFINQVDNPFLDRENANDGFGYCVFGRVLSGMGLVDWIAQLPTYSIGGLDDVPIYTDANENSWWVYVFETVPAPPGCWLQPDLNNNGAVNLHDFAKLAANFSVTADELPGDLDSDGTIDLIDLELFADGWLQETSWYWLLQADLNNDIIVNLRDFTRWASDWSKTADGLMGDLDGDGRVDLADLVLLTNVWLQTVN